MLREIAAVLRRQVAMPALAIAIVVPTLAACGIKGPLRLPPPVTDATPATPTAEAPASAKPPAERKP